MASANKNLKAGAYRKIKEMIIECGLEPGIVINENQLCEQLGISRTPVRESICRLEAEGFLQILPKKGIYVTGITLNDVLQVFQTRILAEPIALKLAGPNLPQEELQNFRERFLSEQIDIKNSFRLDTAMHIFIFEYCGNRFLIDMLHRVFAENTRIIISSKQNEVKIHNAQMEHREILDLLLARKFDEAAFAMQEHIKTCRQAALDYFYENQNLSYFSEKSSYKDILSRI